MTDVSVGGLSGKQMDIALAPDAVVPTGDCPVKRFLGLLNAQGSTWAWDWGIADSEMQRVYALDGKDGVVLVFVDSLDGTTFDSLTKAADTILKTVKFDQYRSVSRPCSRRGARSAVTTTTGTLTADFRRPGTSWPSQREIPVGRVDRMISSAGWLRSASRAASTGSR